MKGCYKRTYSSHSGQVGIIVTAILSLALFSLTGCLTDPEPEPQPTISALSSSEIFSSSEIISSSSSSLTPTPETSSSAPDLYFSVLSSSSELPPSIPESPSKPEAYSKTIIDGISILVDTTFFIEKFHTPSVKIVFKDDETGALNYIEMDRNLFRHEIIPTPEEPNHPQFSPDGSKIAFSSQYEGSPQPSSALYVIDLASAEHFIYKLDVASAAIPRWRILDNGDTAILFNDYTGSNKSFQWNNSGTYVVTYSNNTFGTPQKIFNRSYNGGVSYDNTLAVTGSSKLLFHYATDNDTTNIDMYNEEQVCNVSISRDSSKIVSFLETRGSMGMQFTQNRRYNWHQYIFYMDAMGSFLKAIKADDGYVFNGTEWLFLPGYQVSTVTSSNDLTESIVLIDYEMGSYYTIVYAPGKQIDYPDIWAGGR